MSKILVGIVCTLLAAIAAAGVVVYSGAFDVAADTPHAAVTYRLIAFARERSIARRIEDIAPPGDLGDVARVRRGVGNYAAMCSGCHLEPGVENSEVRAGLYPQPPNLAKFEAGSSRAAGGAARKFWIIKHGIKASGMPAWSKGGMEDAAIWDLVAFVQRLPKMPASEYRELVESSDGHSHAGRSGVADHSTAPEGVPDRHESGHGDGNHKHAR
jgi:mono/diheme cytochrome c family protein